MTDDLFRALERELSNLPRHEWDEYLTSFCRRWLGGIPEDPTSGVGDEEEPSHAG